MKTIATFGCSYTAGHGTFKKTWINWPAELSIIANDKIKIYNCAKGGTSIEYSLFALENFLKNYTPDIVLFQLTSPNRFTYIPDDQNEQNIFKTTSYYEYITRNIPKKEIFQDYKKLENHFLYTLNDSVQWGFITPGFTKSIHSNKVFANLYYRLVGQNKIDTTKNKAYSKYLKDILKDIPHLILSHDVDVTNPPYDIVDFNFKTILGEEYFDENVVDEGRHLSRPALQKLAKFIYSQLIEREYL